ncbi:MAG: hypothetical protein AB1439_09255 [candidate division FCPU426 bacterium]
MRKTAVIAWVSLLGFFAAGAGMLFLVSGCCTPQRWTEGDPRAVTPLPTPVVLERVEIGIGNTLNAEGQ